MVGPAVSGQRISGGQGAEPSPTSHNEPDETTGDDRTKHLGNHIGEDLGAAKFASGPEAEGDGGVDVAAGNMTNGVNHGQQGETKGERNAKESKTQRVVGVVVGEGGGKNGGAATTKDQPKRAKQLGEKLFGERNSESHSEKMN